MTRQDTIKQIIKLRHQNLIPSFGYQIQYSNMSDKELSTLLSLTIDNQN